MPSTPEKFLIIIGSPKAGTTTLASWLGARDDMVLGRIKEPRFFTDFHERRWSGPGHERFVETLLADENAYRANYETETGAAWAIDASTDYLWCPAAPERIRAFARRHPTRLICILRDPVERALSEYNHTLRDRLEDQPLERALELEQARMAQGWQPLFYHRRRSQVAADLQRYAELFGDDLLVLGFHEFAAPGRMLRRVQDFLGLEGPPTRPGGVQNRSDLPRNRLVARLFASEALKAAGRRLIGPALRARLRRLTHAPAAKIRPASTADRARLRDLLAEEIAACIRSPLIDTGNWRAALQD